MLAEGCDLVETFVRGPALVARAKELATGDEIQLDQLEALVARKTAVPRQVRANKAISSNRLPVLSNIWPGSGHCS